MTWNQVQLKVKIIKKVQNKITTSSICIHKFSYTQRKLNYFTVTMADIPSDMLTTDPTETTNTSMETGKLKLTIKHIYITDVMK